MPCPKLALSEIIYKYITNLDSDVFRADLILKLGEQPTKLYGMFGNTLLVYLTFSILAHEKNKYARANQKPYDTKVRGTAIMKRFRT